MPVFPNAFRLHMLYACSVSVQIAYCRVLSKLLSRVLTFRLMAKRFYKKMLLFWRRTSGILLQAQLRDLAAELKAQAAGSAEPSRPKHPYKPPPVFNIIVKHDGWGDDIVLQAMEDYMIYHHDLGCCLVSTNLYYVTLDSNSLLAEYSIQPH